MYRLGHVARQFKQLSIPIWLLAAAALSFYNKVSSNPHCYPAADFGNWAVSEIDNKSS
jgi:hypothetical protein